MFGMLNRLWTMVQARLAEIKDDLSRKPLVQAIRNLTRGLRHWNATRVAAAMLARYPHCYLVNADFIGFPGIALAEYRTCTIDHVPLVRVSEREGAELMAGRQAYPIDFKMYGATLVAGDGVLPLPAAVDIVGAIEANGWHILTVDDARRILLGRDMAHAVNACLSTRNTWLTMVENAADRIGIAESLFPFCERVIAARTAIIVVYTPGLPRPLRLWRLSMKWIMPPLPPVA